MGGRTLKHLVTLDEAGAVVLPASPGFYAGATHIQDLVDFVAGRVLDAAGVPHRLYRRWEGELGALVRSRGQEPLSESAYASPHRRTALDCIHQLARLLNNGRLQAYGRRG